MKNEKSEFGKLLIQMCKDTVRDYKENEIKIRKITTKKRNVRI